MSVPPPRSGLADPMESYPYDSASLDYQRASEQFWKFLSIRTVEQMDMRPRGTVLDVACGPGASSVAAAERVGPEGSVVALDSSDQMLRMAGERAAARRLGNVEPRLGDMAQLDLPPDSFDAVISVLGVFYVPDMPALISSMWNVLRPGGQLAITTLGPRTFEPAYNIWKEAVRVERPDATPAYSWERTNEPEGVRSLLLAAGIENPDVSVEEREVPIRTIDDWWLAVMGSGMRRTVLELGDEAADRVRASCDDMLRRAGVATIRMSAIYALATKG